MRIFLQKPIKTATKKYSFDDCVLAFEKRKKTEKRRVRTIKTYLDELNRFREYANAIQLPLDNIQNITKETMLEYINHLTYDKQKWDNHPTNSSCQIGLKPKTINNMKRIMSSFFNFLVEEKIINENPVSNIKDQPLDEDFFEVFSKEQIEKLLDQPNLRTFTGFRDYVVILIMLDTGIRMNELFNIKVRDIDLTLQHIVVLADIAKTGKTRILPISRKTTIYIQELIAYCRLSEDDFLILSQYGTPYSGNTFAKNLKKYGQKAGITNVRCSPHTLRHTFATLYLLNGGDTISLQRILGHSDQSMVSRYVHFTKSNIKDQHVKYSPVAHIKTKGTKNGKIIFK